MEQSHRKKHLTFLQLMMALEGWPLLIMSYGAAKAIKSGPSMKFNL